MVWRGRRERGSAWWATVHRVTKSRTGLSDFTFTFKHYNVFYVFVLAAGEIQSKSYPAGPKEASCHSVEKTMWAVSRTLILGVGWGCWHCQGAHLPASPHSVSDCRVRECLSCGSLASSWPIPATWGLARQPSHAGSPPAGSSGAWGVPGLAPGMLA